MFFRREPPRGKNILKNRIRKKLLVLEHGIPDLLHQRIGILFGVDEAESLVVVDDVAQRGFRGFVAD